MRGSPTVRTTVDSITAAHRLIVDEFARDLVRSLTEYALHASPERLAEMLEQAYGDHGPDSVRRWREQWAARQRYEQMARERAAWSLYRRVHGRPAAAEAAYLASPRASSTVHRAARQRTR